MSLINKMLQELDARSSDAARAGSFGPQIRAVPEYRRIHPAWWVALILAGMLAGALAWIFMQPAKQVPGVHLPLKLDPDLTATPKTVPLPVVRDEPEADVMHAPATDMQARPASSVYSSTVMESRQESALAAESVLPPMRQKTETVPDNKTTTSAELAQSQAPKALKETVNVVNPAAMPEVPVRLDKQIKELTPQQRAENEFRKAAALLQQGKSAEAAAGLVHALKLDPHHTGARQALIGIQLEGRQQDEAMRMAREGLDVNPAQPGLAMILARLQLEKGELRHAVETLQGTLEYASGRADFHAFFAAVLQRDERHKHAAEQYLIALQKQPQNGIWWMGLGISLQAEKRVQEAQDAFMRAKASNSLSPELQAFVDARLKQLQN